tara:strand:- start:3668 stop:4720 length:1053 start_codon:yes stop_codon:yes gene_type:complete
MTIIGAEERSIRPIVGDEQIVEAFSQISLKFENLVTTNDQDRINHGETKRLTESDFLSASVKVEFSETQSGFKEFCRKCEKSIKSWNIPLKDITVVVFVLNPLLRLADKVLEKTMEEFATSDHYVQLIDGSNRPKAAWSIHNETRVEVVAYLNKKQKFELLQPYKVGTWIAKADFRIKTELETASFTVEPLDQQERIRLGDLAFGNPLPTGTVTYLELPRDFNPVDPNSDIQELRMFLNEDVWHRRENDPDSTLTNVLNRFLAVEVFTEVFDVAQHFLTLNDDWDSLESTTGSILHNAICTMSLDQQTRENYFELAKKDPRALRAIWEDLHIENQGISDLQNAYKETDEK